MTNYRFIGNHPQDFNSGDKVLMVEPGGFVELSDDDLNSHGYQELVDNGMLLSAGAHLSAPAEAKTTTGGDK